MERIGNLAEFKRGPFGSAVKKSVCVPKSPGTYKLYEQGNVINNDFNRGRYYLTKERFDLLSQFEIKPGDLLLTCAGTLGKIAIVPEKIEKGIFNSVLMRIRPDYSKVIRKYFYYYFQSPKIQNDINKQSAGVAIKNLFATKRLKEYTIYFPDKKEQQQIVDEIEKQLTRLDDAVKTFKEVKKKLDVYRKSVLFDIFDPDKGFEKVELDTVCTIISGFAFKSKDFIKVKGINVIKITNVGYNYYVDEEKDYLPEEYLKNYPRFIVEPNTILLTLTRPITNNKLKVCIYPKDKKPALLNQRVAKILPKEGVLNEYLVYFFQSDWFKKEMKKGMTETLQPNLSPKKAEKFLISMCEWNKQQQIVQEIESRFSVIDKLEETVDKSLKKAELLRKSILKAAFEGKLTKGEIHV